MPTVSRQIHSKTQKEHKKALVWFVSLLSVLEALTVFVSPGQIFVSDKY